MSNVPPHTHPRHEHAQYATTAEVVSQAYVDTADALKAPLASPALTGTPTAPTAAAGTSTTQLATTAFVTAADNLKANLASPALTGTPTAPTAAAGTSTTQLATTAFVTNAGTWNSYTPQVDQGATTNIAKTIQYAKYLQFGKLVFCRVRLSITGTGTSGQTIYISLPVTPSYRGGTCGTATLVDSGTLWIAGAAVRIDPVSDYVYFHAAAYNPGIGLAPAYALAAGDYIEFEATYEAA